MSVRWILVPCLTLLLVAVLASVGAEAAAPTGVSVSPRVAATGVDVSVAGRGCTSTVQVTVTTWSGTPVVVEDLDVVPEVSGGWQATFAMPARPAYVIATCDSVESQPVVITPNDIGHSRSSLIDTTETELIVGGSSQYIGAEFAIFDLSGNLLGSTIATSDRTEVRLPRSLGAQTVLGIGLSDPADQTITDPFIPLVRAYDLPLAADTTIALSPRVSEAGVSVSAQGICAGTPTLVVTGRTLGWNDQATVFLDVVATSLQDNAWAATFPMPPIAATASITCRDGSTTGQASSVISASDGGVMIPALAIGADDPTIVTVSQPSDSDGPYEAFTSTGDPITLSLNAAQRIELTVPSQTIRIVIFGRTIFGENAEALQVSSVQSWYLDLAPTAEATTEPTAEPTVQATPVSASAPTPTPPALAEQNPALPIVVIEPTASATPLANTAVTTAPALVDSEPALAFTGFSTDWLLLSGAAMIVAGAGTCFAGRVVRRASKPDRRSAPIS